MHRVAEFVGHHQAPAGRRPVVHRRRHPSVRFDNGSVGVARAHPARLVDRGPCQRRHGSTERRCGYRRMGLQFHLWRGQAGPPITPCATHDDGTHRSPFGCNGASGGHRSLHSTQRGDLCAVHHGHPPAPVVDAPLAIVGGVKAGQAGEHRSHLGGARRGDAVRLTIRGRPRIGILGIQATQEAGDGGARGRRVRVQPVQPPQQLTHRGASGRSGRRLPLVAEQERDEARPSSQHRARPGEGRQVEHPGVHRDKARRAPLRGIAVG